MAIRHPRDFRVKKHCGYLLPFRKELAQYIVGTKGMMNSVQVCLQKVRPCRQPYCKAPSKPEDTTQDKIYRRHRYIIMKKTKNVQNIK